MQNIRTETLYNNDSNSTQPILIRRGMVINTNVPFQPSNPRQHHGRHYYVVVANEKACKHSPVLQVIPFSHTINRRLPCQVNITTKCLPKQSCILADQLTLMSRDILNAGNVCGILEDYELKLVEQAIKTQLAIA